MWSVAAFVGESLACYLGAEGVVACPEECTISRRDDVDRGMDNAEALEVEEGDGSKFDALEITSLHTHALHATPHLRLRGSGPKKSKKPVGPSPSHQIEALMIPSTKKKPIRHWLPLMSLVLEDRLGITETDTGMVWLSGRAWGDGSIGTATLATVSRTLRDLSYRSTGQTSARRGRRGSFMQLQWFHIRGVCHAGMCGSLG